MTINTNPVIEVKNLYYSYNNQTNIINGINFKVNEGEFVGLLGPNGAGKTTLFNIISGILPFYKGSVNIFNKNLKKMNYKERANIIGVVPQESTSNFNFKNIDIVLMSRICKKPQFANEDQNDYKIALNAMKLTKTDHLAKKGYMEISGGEKQRVIIAQAIAQETKILLLDEPTSNLDINFQIEIMQMISKISKNSNITIVGIFHDMNIAAQYSDRIILISDGKIFAEGLPSEVLTPYNIKSVYNANVIVEKNPFTNKIFIIPYYNDHCLPLSPEKRKKIHVIAGGGSGSYLFNILVRDGHKLSTCILSSIDTDTRTALRLGIEMVKSDHHIALEEESIRKNEDLICKSDIVVVGRVLFGEINYSNLESVKKALKLKKEVYFIDGKNFKKRDFTGGKASQLYTELLKMGAKEIETEEEFVLFLRNKDISVTNNNKETINLNNNKIFLDAQAIIN